MKRTLYVVDDQTPVLETAVLILKMIDREWDVTGFNDPLLALEAVKAKAPDLVLSDQLMPGMQGSQLLEKVRGLAPAAVRIIMSGYVALNKLTLITSAHQYIAKPFDASKLRDIVKRSFAAQERIVNPGLQAVVTSLSSIPSLSQVHQSLLHELEDTRTGTTAIARMVADDPGLSLKALQLANSPLFGKGYLITSPVDAVMCLGTDMIAAIVLSQSLFRHYESLKRPDMDLQRVWAHSWETACLAQHICRDKRLAAKIGEEAFLAGLMHEIGRFILVDNFPDQFKAACDGARNTKSPLSPRLRETFQTTPAQVGAYVLELWGLPTAVVSAVGGADDPQEDQGNGFTMTSALYIADRIASSRFPADGQPLEPWRADYLQFIGCAQDVPNWEKFFARTENEARGD
ncbi:MAG TPA: HDOD domain-containing protein [Verrucomicrobiae bacterium]|jgi:HD-like signal output (HDOD) protein|nr:HDOD domain-containing protein [Verrucomicrobiae bacterium]